jgi:hypothetical protein
VLFRSKERHEAAQANGKTTAPPEVIDPKTGMPAGLDKGWDYNVGAAAFGKSWVPETGPVKELEPAWRPAQYPHLPQKMAVNPLPVALATETRDPQSLRKLVPEGIYTDVTGEAVNVTQKVVDHFLADVSRLEGGRQRYLPLLPDVIQNASEVWAGFIRHTGSGRVFLRRRYVRAYTVQKGRVVGVLAEVINGQIVAFDLIKSSDLKGGRLRSGRLVYPNN